MGGGLLQLVSKGQIDDYLVANPQISFYEYVFKRHTNFAMESRINEFISVSNKLTDNTNGNIIKCQINRHGDLLGNMFFCFTLPAVYSSDKYRFQWVKNIGSIIMKEATITLDGGIVLDKVYGEWMNIWNELTTIGEYDDMIGNDPELYNPRKSNDRITVKNNRFIYYYYPESTNGIPSIKERKLVIPLNFWFTKTPALALPLLRLQFYNIELSIEKESPEKLYKIYSAELDEYISPSYYNELYGENIKISQFLDPDHDLNQYIEANYIFLDNDERMKICYKPTLTYLVEQIKHTTRTGIIVNESVEINANIPIKEFVWVLRRDDVYNFNENINYSPSIPESRSGIMEKASINFFNRTRLNEKDEVYFNVIQPYQHHTNMPKNGIYCYSFGIYPEKEILSGY